jgi:arabinofuranan 3-O-arabinosyltransferase
LADVVIDASPSRTAQRNRGALADHADVVGFVDSDMVAEPDVVAQAVAAIEHGAASVVVPEASFGTTFWARVRAFERSFYVGVPAVEAARFFSRSTLAATGGFDETLAAAEDTDLARRAAALGPTARTMAMLQHDEGALRYIDACRRKGGYAGGLVMYTRRHGRGALIELLLSRPYLRRPWRLARRPLLGFGVVLLKLGEATAVLTALVSHAGRRGEDVERSVTRGRAG